MGPTETCAMTDTTLKEDSVAFRAKRAAGFHKLAGNKAVGIDGVRLTP